MFVDDIADLLNISIDAVCRRMRGESALTFEEAILLSKKYHISIAEEFKMPIKGSKNAVFNYSSLFKDANAIHQYWLKLVGDLEKINNVTHKQITYSAVDMPIFYYFNFEGLLKFKLSYWHKSLMDIEN